MRSCPNPSEWARWIADPDSRIVIWRATILHSLAEGIVEVIVRRALMAVVLLLAMAASAQAVTLRDIIDLSKAGLGDEVLLALIEVDGGVFNVDTDTLTRLKAAGVSERVIVALVRSGRSRPPALERQPEDFPPLPAEPISPQVVYVQPPPTEIVREVAVPLPVYIAVPGGHRGRRGHPAAPATADPMQPSITAPQLIHGPTRFLTDTPPPPASREPVYWGWGGKLRPDAWKPK